ncbi:MAG: hypothetical protein RLZZ414_1727 [Bacteroidota bacterium]|jgi:large subunit ribosomal protein L14
MIQIGTFVTVSDNSGARKAQCIGIYQGFQSRYANIGNIILISIKKLRSKRRDVSKVKKGQIYKALIIRTKSPTLSYNEKYSFKENSVVILNQKNKLLGTRIFGSVPKKLRFTKFLKITTLAFGIMN